MGIIEIRQAKHEENKIKEMLTNFLEYLLRKLK